MFNLLHSGFPEIIETTILPTVGEDVDLLLSSVCVTLQVLPCDGYPDISPAFYLKKPRGLDDESINVIKQAILKKLNESIGLPVVFDLIEVIREHLSESNLPSCHCVVCLYGFQDGDQFAKTDCYHYLHSYCLARHLLASKKNYQEEQDKLPAWQRKLSKPFQPFCPVCREAIFNDVEPLLKSIPPIELENAPKFELTDDLIQLQNKMAGLFLHQRHRGGIINLEEEENNVISIETEESVNEIPKTVTTGENNQTDQTVQQVYETNQPPIQQQSAQQQQQHHRSNRSSYRGGGHNRGNRHHYNRSRRVHSHNQQNASSQQGNANAQQQPCGSTPR